jgi:hypothetical protein
MCLHISISTGKIEMPKIKEPKRKPAILPCVFDRLVYEVYADGKLVKSYTSFTRAKREATRLRRLSKKPRYPERVTIKMKSTCTYGPEACKYWKSCLDLKGTTFTESWGKKKVFLLEMKRQQEQEPKKDKELDQFLDS